ncbi:hypothetical protein K7887_02585 [Sutcliffiella horikoshii]|uniref:hypothetical protein n=1 Tax=Sutcliffiella horikoshii TaxID=79883 RepID=UPI001CBD983E|nr:hypothetical protein [Sutcliffiella horikoshii]UAL47874.1 hypothetical protein K7887_02585 [Sutcliffiella horikoshii]
MIKLLLFSLLMFAPLQPLNTDVDIITSSYLNSGFTTIEKATTQYEKEFNLILKIPDTLPFNPTHSFGRYIDRGYFKGTLELEYVDSSNMDVLVIWLAQKEHEVLPLNITKQVSLEGGIIGKFIEGKEHASISKLKFEYEGNYYMIEYIRALSKPYVKAESLVNVANSIIH